MAYKFSRRAAEQTREAVRYVQRQRRHTTGEQPWDVRPTGGGRFIGYTIDDLDAALDRNSPETCRVQRLVKNSDGDLIDGREDEITNRGGLMLDAGTLVYYERKLGEYHIYWAECEATESSSSSS